MCTYGTPIMRPIMREYTVHILLPFIDDEKKEKMDSHKDVSHYLFLLCFSLQRRDMKNLQTWNFKTLTGCSQIDAAGETERAGVPLSSSLQCSLSSGLSNVKIKANAMMMGRPITKLIFFHFRLLWLLAFLSTLLINVGLPQHILSLSTSPQRHRWMVGREISKRTEIQESKRLKSAMPAVVTTLFDCF